ncbi:MAG: flavin reductase [Sulfurospirillum sp.]|nr:MAG: flavin reductase [Sulfurospirillum sp.]
MLIDYATQTVAQRYALMAQTIIPRPVAWIVTEDSEGRVNIAPFSYFTGLSSQPPTVVVSIGHKSDGTPKDTLQNIRNTKRCTLCMTDESRLEAMHFSSKPLPHERSEADYFKIPLEKVADGFPPIVEGVPAAFFCTLYQEIVLEGSKTIPLVLEIREHYIREDAVEKEDGKYRIRFSPVARTGGKYAFLGEEIDPPKIP